MTVPLLSFAMLLLFAGAAFTWSPLRLLFTKPYPPTRSIFIPEKMKNILIIDDEFLSADLLAGLLKRNANPDLQVRISTSINAAMQLLEDYTPELVLLNLELPKAFEFLDHARSASFNIIVTISSMPEALIAVKFIELDHLVKPFDPAQVEALLSRYSIRPAQHTVLA